MERVLSSWKGVTEWLFLDTASAVCFLQCPYPRWHNHDYALENGYKAGVEKELI